MDRTFKNDDILRKSNESDGWYHSNFPSFSRSSSMEYSDSNSCDCIIDTVLNEGDSTLNRFKMDIDNSSKLGYSQMSSSSNMSFSAPPGGLFATVMKSAENISLKLPKHHSTLSKNLELVNEADQHHDFKHSVRSTATFSIRTNLLANNLFGTDSPPVDSGFQTPKDTTTDTERTQKSKNSSVSTSFEDVRVLMNVTGKRSSPNDITLVPEARIRQDSTISTTSDTLLTESDELSPSRLNTEFDILDIVGKGISGYVYRARSKRDGTVYAIKQSRRQYRGAFDKNKMLHEVDAMKAIVNERTKEAIETLVNYVSYWFEDHHVLIQMELCDMNIESMIANAYLFTTEEVYQICQDMLQALAVLHRNDYVHLDVKPANIMKKGNRYKLGDFGLAVHTNHGQAAASVVEEGDCRYMARELLDWGPIPDLTKCDIFSLGVSLYEVFTGLPTPLNGPKWHSLRDGTFTFPGTVTSTEFVVDVVKEMLTPNPPDRPSAIDSLRKYFPDVTISVISQRNDEESSTSV